MTLEKAAAEVRKRIAATKASIQNNDLRLCADGRHDHYEGKIDAYTEAEELISQISISPAADDLDRAELEALLREEAERQRKNRKSLIRMQSEMFAKSAHLIRMQEEMFRKGARSRAAAERQKGGSK